MEHSTNPRGNKTADYKRSKQPSVQCMIGLDRVYTPARPTTKNVRRQSGQESRYIILYIYIPGIYLYIYIDPPASTSHKRVRKSVSKKVYYCIVQKRLPTVVNNRVYNLFRTVSIYRSPVWGQTPQIPTINSIFPNRVKVKMVKARLRHTPETDFRRRDSVRPEGCTQNEHGGFFLGENSVDSSLGVYPFALLVDKASAERSLRGCVV